MFISFASTIEGQFEFITRRWASSLVQPGFGGHDPIMGRRDERGDRKRFVECPDDRATRTLELGNEWVVPTGGGYLFAPPISAVVSVLGAKRRARRRGKSG